MKYWQWHRYYERRVPNGKKIVLINLDETSVCFAPELRSGLVVIRSSSEAKALVAKQDTRSNLTYVATVCDDESVQASMPHFIIGDKTRIRDTDMVSLRESPKNNVHVWRNEKSAWNNHTLMQRILTVIRDALSHRPDLLPVLILDVAPYHIHKSVFQKARQLGIWLVFVPSRVTYLLQPWLLQFQSMASQNVRCAAWCSCRRAGG